MIPKRGNRFSEKDHAEMTLSFWQELTSGQRTQSVIAGLDRQSILLRKKLDDRVKPGHYDSTKDNPV
jgi:hypothetical protein